MVLHFRFGFPVELWTDGLCFIDDSDRAVLLVRSRGLLCDLDDRRPSGEGQAQPVASLEIVVKRGGKVLVEIGSRSIFYSI